MSVSTHFQLSQISRVWLNGGSPQSVSISLNLILLWIWVRHDIHSDRGYPHFSSPLSNMVCQARSSKGGVQVLPTIILISATRGSLLVNVKHYRGEKNTISIVGVTTGFVMTTKRILHGKQDHRPTCSWWHSGVDLAHFFRKLVPPDLTVLKSKEIIQTRSCSKCYLNTMC